MLSLHTWAAFLALISPFFTSLNPFEEFFRPLQPHSTSHNWGIWMKIPGTISALPVIENAVMRNKPCTRNQFASEWVTKISRGLSRINKFSGNLNSLSIFTLNIKQFLWKYHILPTLIWTALVLLRSKKRPWKVYSPEQNSAFCNSFSSSKPTCVQLPFEILRLPKTKKGAAKIESFFKRPDTGTGRILGNIL